MSSHAALWSGIWRLGYTLNHCGCLRVKVSESFSGWATPLGGMPQGSWLGPLIFVILVDDLRTELLTNKFVGDTKVSEIMTRGSVSEMQRTVGEVIQ